MWAALGAALKPPNPTKAHTHAHSCTCLHLLLPAPDPAFRCQFLDAAADGYVRGEAVLAMVLRNHSMVSVLRSGCSGMAIMGSAVNQDGRSSSLTAPSGPAQQVGEGGGTAGAAGGKGGAGAGRGGGHSS